MADLPKVVEIDPSVLLGQRFVERCQRVQVWRERLEPEDIELAQVESRLLWVNVRGRDGGVWTMLTTDETADWLVSMGCRVDPVEED
jgi:hypothetical protein